MSTNTNTTSLQNRSGGKLGMFIKAVACIAAPLIVGLISSRITLNQMEEFGQISKPPLAPPAWLFPIAWTILYILMGIACYLIIRSDSKYKEGAVALYVAQLIMNFIWSPVFFNLQQYWLALSILLLMWMTEIVLAVVCRFIDRRATLCLVPLIAWTTFAAYLNAGVAVLN